MDVSFILAFAVLVGLFFVVPTCLDLLGVGRYARRAEQDEHQQPVREGDLSGE